MRTVVGLATVQLAVPGAASLKDKRSVSRRLSERLRHRFNVAVAEIGSLDAWTTLTLGIVCISSSQRHAQSMLDHVIASIETLGVEAELIDHRIELL